MTQRLGGVSPILFAVVGFYLVAATLWCLLVPPFEKADEIHHFAYVQFVATQHRIPGPDVGSDAVAFEAHQPPLYYVLAAVAYRIGQTAGLPSTDPQAWVARADGTFTTRTTFFAHDEHLGGTDYPYDLLMVRGFSGLLGLATLLLIYGFGWAVLRDADWAAAAAGFALVPQFTHMATAANNDVVAAAAGAAMLLLLASVLRRPAPSKPRLLVLGASTGLLALAKLNALPLAAATLLILVAPIRLDATPSARRRWRPVGARLESPSAALANLAWVVAGSVAVAGPYLLWAWRTYGTPFLVPTLLAPGRFDAYLVPLSITDPYFRTAFPRILATSFLGRFSFMRVGMPPGWYAAWAVAAGLAGLGLARRCLTPLVSASPSAPRNGGPEGVRARSSRSLSTAVMRMLPLSTEPWGLGLGLAGLAVGLTVAAVVWVNLSTNQPQGRYLFPALAAFGVLAAEGWRSSLPRASIRGTPVAPMLVVAALFAANLSALAVLVHTSY